MQTKRSRLCIPIPAARGSSASPARRGRAKARSSTRSPSAIGRRVKTVGILAVDPTSPFTGGAILGDRIRMRDLSGDSGVFIRSMATRGSLGGLARATRDAIRVLDAARLRPDPGRDGRRGAERGRHRAQPPIRRWWSKRRAWATTCRRSRRASSKSPTCWSSTRRIVPASATRCRRCKMMLELGHPAARSDDHGASRAADRRRSQSAAAIPPRCGFRRSFRRSPARTRALMPSSSAIDAHRRHLEGSDQRAAHRKTAYRDRTVRTPARQH